MSGKMEKINGYLSSLVDLMEQNSRGVHIACYSVALLGLTVAVRKVRPFSRFKKPSDIPKHFIEEKRKLTGFVERIEPSGALLLVKHKPLIPLPEVRNGALPVKISGVNVSGLGISWLQTIVAGNEVQFVPVAKEMEAVLCEVLLTQAFKEKGKEKLRTVNVGESLVSIGFGTIVETPLKTDDKYWINYYNKLKRAEAYALRQKLGLKYYVKPTKEMLSFIGRKVNGLIKKAVAKSSAAKVPKLSTA